MTTAANAASPPWIKSLLKGGGIGMLGQTAQAGLAITFQWYMARTLGAAGLGVYTLSFSIMSLAMLFALLGLNRGIVKFVAHYNALGEPEKAKGIIVSAFRIYSVSSIIVSLILFLGAEYINARFFQEPALVAVLRWMALLLIVSGWITLLVNIPLAYRRVEYQTVVQQIFIPGGSLVLSMIFVFVVGQTLLSFVYAVVLASILGLVLALWRLLRFKPLQRLWLEKSVFETRKLLSFSTPLFFTQLLNRTESQLSFLFLGAFAVIADVGIYRIGTRLTLPLSIMVIALVSISSPIIASLYAKGEITELGKLYRFTTRWMLTAALPIFLVIVLIPEDLLRIFGDEFVAAVPVLRLIAFAQLINVATGSSGIVLQMTKYVALNLINAVLVLTIAILLQVYLIPLYGILGAAIADTVGIVLLNTLRLIQVFLFVKIHPFERAELKPVIAMLLTVPIAILALRYGPMNLLLQIVYAVSVVITIYIGFLAVLGFSDADRQIFNTGMRYITRRI